jgi:hypothetical protein
MTELLKHLNEDDEESIPLLYNEVEDSEETVGLFTEEEIKSSQRRKNIKLTLKLLIPLAFIALLIFGAFNSYRNISYNLKNQKIQYKVHSLSVKEGKHDKALLVTVNATIDTSIPWSIDVTGVNIDLLDSEDNSSKILSIKLNKEFKIVSGKSIPLLLFDQSIEIKDSEALAKLISKSANDKFLRARLSVETEKIHPHWSPFTLKGLQIEKEINVDLKSNGIGDISKNVKLIDLKMKESSGDELIVSAKLELKNPLPITVDRIPPVAFKVYSATSVYIGKLKTVGDVRLVHSGFSQVELQGNLGSSDNNSDASDAIGEIITNHLIGKSSRIYLQGDDTVKSLNWLQALLIHVRLPIDIPGRKGERMFEDSIKSIDIKRILFALDPSKPSHISLDSDAEIQFQIPRFASFMQPSIESLDLEGRVHDQQGNFIAPLSISNQKLVSIGNLKGSSSSNGSNTVNTSMKMDIEVNSQNVGNVESLMAEMLYSRDFTSISVSGHSSVRTKMILGKLTVPRVPFEAEIKLPGLGRILAASHATRITNFKILEISESELVASALITIYNPTEITSKMGPMHLKCFTESTRKEIGQVYLSDASIRPGSNELEAKMQFENNSDFQELVISKYFSGKEQEIILQGINGSEAVHPLIKNVIGAFVMTVKIDPMSDSAVFGKFVSSVTLKRAKFNLIPQAFMTVSNPFNFPIKIISIHNLKVYAYKASKEEVLITEMDQVPLEEPIIIPANVENWIDEENPLPLQMNGNILRSLKALEMFFNRKNPKDSNGRQYLPICFILMQHQDF